MQSWVSLRCFISVGQGGKVRRIFHLISIWFYTYTTIPRIQQLTLTHLQATRKKNSSRFERFFPLRRQLVLEVRNGWSSLALRNCQVFSWDIHRLKLSVETVTKWHHHGKPRTVLSNFTARQHYPAAFFSTQSSRPSHHCSQCTAVTAVSVSSSSSSSSALSSPLDSYAILSEVHFNVENVDRCVDLFFWQ